MAIQKYIALLVLAAVTTASGVMQGNATFRWGVPAELEQAAVSLAEVDFSVGNWELKERQSFDPSVLRMLRSVGYIKQVYENEVTSDAVAVAVFVGPAGALFAHTPVVCYPANSYEIVTSPVKVEIEGSDGSKHELMAVTFRSGNVHRSLLRVYYGWAGSEGEYRTPSGGRLATSDQSFVYRIQVAAELGANTENIETDAALSFLQQSLRRQTAEQRIQ